MTTLLFSPRTMIIDPVRSLINCTITKVVSCPIQPKQRSLRQHNRWDRFAFKVKSIFDFALFLSVDRLQPISVLYSVFTFPAFKISSVIHYELVSRLNAVTFSFRCHCLYSFVLADWHCRCTTDPHHCRPLQCMRMWD